jgi:subtilase family serine protease
VALGASAAVLLLGGSAAASAPAPRRIGFAPRLPAGARVVGALSQSTRMTATVVLAPRDPAGLQAYATAVSTPGSSVYHRYLTVAQFRARFAPADAQIAAVSASLHAHGLSPGPVSANGLAIPLTSTAGAIGRAFSTTLERVALAGGRTAFVNSEPPLLDASVAGIVSNVVGLDDLAVPHPLALRGSAGRVAHASRHVLTGGPTPCPAASSAASSNRAYTADQIASAYGFSGLYGAGDFGAGQTVAVYELEGNFSTDITAYESCYGIPTGNVSYSKVDRGPPPPTPGQDGIETELDVENVVGLAPHANVIVYQGPNSNSGLPGAGPYDVYSAIISQDLAKVISTSWGICEAQNTPSPTVAQDENTLFQEAATQGQSVFAAAGDDGSEDCVNPFTQTPELQLAVDDPGTQPFVTSAGGTTMPAIGPPPTESAWNGGCTSGPCGGGGGVSQIWPMPSYQSGAPAGLNVINAHSSGSPCGAPAGSYCREVPDVSADADPATGYTIYYDGNGSANDTTGWTTETPIGGTSAAAPLWAALMAEVNASSACKGTPIGFANPVLYGTAGHLYAGHFNDITTGNNDALGTNGGLYPAGPGYDMATGLGSPNAAALASNLCAPAIGVSNPGSQTTRVRTAASLQVAATDSAGNALSYGATGLPPGLSISARTGAISGSPSTPGVYSVTVRAADARGSIGSATFNWTVQGLPTVSRKSLTGVGKHRPTLSFTLTAGSHAPALRQIVVSLPKGFSFARKHLRKGITVNGSHRLFFKLSGRKLTITLRHGAGRARVVIKAPALSAPRALKRGKKLKFTLHAIDTSGFGTTFHLKLKPS